MDINRNFGWEFGGKGSSRNRKDEEYRGAHAFSGKIYLSFCYHYHVQAFAAWKLLVATFLV